MVRKLMLMALGGKKKMRRCEWLRLFNEVCTLLCVDYLLSGHGTRYPELMIILVSESWCTV